MKIYEANLESAPLGALAGWSGAASPSGTAGSFVVVASSALGRGTKAYQQPAATDSTVEYLPGVTLGDGDFVFLQRVNVNTGANSALSGSPFLGVSSDGVGGYAATFTGPSGGSFYKAPGYSDIADYSVPLTDGALVWTRTRRSGANLRFTAWLDGSPEPISPTSQVSDSTYLTGAIGIRITGQATGAVLLGDLVAGDLTLSASTPYAVGVANTGATILWPPATGGTAGYAYSLQYRAGTSGAWTTAAAGSDPLRGSLTGLTAGTPYQYQVVATDAAAGSSTSSPQTFTTTGSAPAPPTVSGVTVTPATATVTGELMKQFAATVAGTNSPSQDVTWTSSAGTINTTGWFTAPTATSAAQSITITATSTLDPTKSGTATATVPAGDPNAAPSITDIRDVVTQIVAEQLGLILTPARLVGLDKLTNTTLDLNVVALAGSALAATALRDLSLGDPTAAIQTTLSAALTTSATLNQIGQAVVNTVVTAAPTNSLGAKVNLAATATASGGSATLDPTTTSAIAAIKAKTDALPAWPANLGSLRIDPTSGGVDLHPDQVMPQRLQDPSNGTITTADCLQAGWTETFGSSDVTGNNYTKGLGYAADPVANPARRQKLVQDAQGFVKGRTNVT